MYYENIHKKVSKYKKKKGLKYIIAKDDFDEITEEKNIIGGISFSVKTKNRKQDKSYLVVGEKYYELEPSISSKKDILGYIYVGDNKYIQVFKKHYFIIIFLIGVLVFLKIFSILFNSNKPIIENQSSDNSTYVSFDSLTIEDAYTNTKLNDDLLVAGYENQNISKENDYIILENPDDSHYIKYTITDTFSERVLLETNLVQPKASYKWENVYETLKNDGNSVLVKIHIDTYTIDKVKCEIGYDVLMRIYIYR